jgi:hypothetical protein
MSVSTFFFKWTFNCLNGKKLPASTSVCVFLRFAWVNKRRHVLELGGFLLSSRWWEEETVKCIQNSLINPMESIVWCVFLILETVILQVIFCWRIYWWKPLERQLVQAGKKEGLWMSHHAGTNSHTQKGFVLLNSMIHPGRTTSQHRIAWISLLEVYFICSC